MKIIETGPREIGFVLWGHCQNLLDDPRIRVADVSRSFGRNKRIIYRLQTHFRQSGSKIDKPPPGRPRIKTPLEARVIVTSS